MCKTASNYSEPDPILGRIYPFPGGASGAVLGARLAFPANPLTFPARGAEDTPGAGAAKAELAPGEGMEGFAIKGGAARTALDVMIMLARLDPQPFEIK